MKRLKVGTYLCYNGFVDGLEILKNGSIYDIFKDYDTEDYCIKLKKRKNAAGIFYVTKTFIDEHLIYINLIEMNNFQIYNEKINKIK